MFSRKSKSSSSMEVKSQFPERDYNSKPSSLPAVVEGQYNQVVSDPEELRANHSDHWKLTLLQTVTGQITMILRLTASSV